MNYFYLLMFTALAATNLSYGMESKEAKASKEESYGIMPALAKAREPKLEKIYQIMIKNNTGIDAALALSYKIKDKDKTRLVQTFLDAWQSMPIPVSMGSYELTGIQAQHMYMGQAAFEPLQLNPIQKARLTTKEAYISLEEIDDRLVINVRNYQKKAVKQKVAKPRAQRAQQASAEAKREVSPSSSSSLTSSVSSAPVAPGGPSA
jgi:hypothetical protein